jgi:hypothetical protein
MKRNCIFCGAEFDTFPCKIRGPNGIYCSLQCRSQHRHLKTMQVRECSECGDMYLVKKLSLSRFCSRECSMVTFHTRRHKARHYRHNPVHDLTPEERKRSVATFHRRYRQSQKGKALHRQDSMLRKVCGTANIGSDEKKKFALYFASCRVLNGRCTRNEYGEKLIQIQQGETYAAYI